MSYGLGLRLFSVRAGEAKPTKADPGVARRVLVEKPEAVGPQVEAFFRRNYLVLLGVGSVVTCALLWRAMFGIANTFIGFSQGMAKYGFLALSSAIVAFANAGYEPDDKPDMDEYGMYPDKAYMDGEDGELMWFNAGVRVGVGIGLSVCLGIGLRVGLLIKTYQGTARSFRRR